MSNYSDWTKQVGDQWVAALKRAEETVAQLGQSAANVDLPKVQVPEQISQLGDALGNRLPDAKEVVEANFELSTRLLGAQRELALKLLNATHQGAASATTGDNPAADAIKKPAGK